MDYQFIPWKRDSDVCGEAAAILSAGRLVDLVVTRCANGTFAWEVIDDEAADPRVAFGIATSLCEARRAAEIAGHRAFIVLAANSNLAA